jgi:zinc protease
MNSHWMQTRSWAPVAYAAGLATVVALLTPAALYAADPPAGLKKVVAIEGITEYRLENGLRVLLFPDPSTPNVTVNLTMFVGSRHEGYGETGMAHLLEHMVFKGTPSHRDVPKALKEHGAQFNGTTWVDRTNYFETMPGTDDNLEFGLKLEADRMVNSFINREDLAKEFSVVRNEFEMGENNPERILSQRMMAVAYEWHNYGKSTIGNRTDIERVPIDKLQAFYKKYYRPDNAMLVVAGKFDEKKALELIVKYFGPLKNPAGKLDNTYTEEPTQDGERDVILRRVGDVGVVGTIYHVPAGAHPDFPAVEVLNSVLVSEPSGRLYKALVESKKASSVSGVAHGWHDPGVIELSAKVGLNVSADAVRSAMVDTLENLAKNKVTAEEVNRAKAEFKRNFDLQMAKSNSIGVTLSEWGAKGDWRLFFLHRDRVAKVTPEDVMRVAGQYLKASNRTVGVFMPTEPKLIARADIPATPDIGDLVKDYKGTETVVSGEAFDPTPENIEKRVKRAVPTQGPKVALLPKKTRGETVMLQLTLRFGNEKSLAGVKTAADFVGDLMERGTEKHTRQQLQDELAKLGARLRVMSDPNAPGVIRFSLEGKKKTFPDAVALLKEVLRSPTFPADEFDVLKRETLAFFKETRSEPRMLAMFAIRRTLNPYPKDDVRYTPTIDEEIARIEAVTLEQIKQVYAKQLGGQASTLVVVGDFVDGEDPTKVPFIADLETLLKNWKSETPYTRIARQARTDIKGDRQVILTPDKKNAIFVAGHKLAMTDSDPDYPALDLANFLLGGGSLSSRLGNRIRQKEGLSYGVNSGFNADAKDKNGSFTMMGISNPENMDRVDKAVAEELEMILKDGVTAKELDEAKKSYLEARKTRRSADAMLAFLLADGLENDRTMAYHADLEKKVAALTPEAVNAAIKKYWDPKKLVIIRAGDFKVDPKGNPDKK